MGIWNNLPGDLLPVISSYFKTYADYVRFRAVCASWRCDLPDWPEHSYHRIPWLMLSCDTQDEKLQGFYNPLNDEICYLELPELQDQFCCGSSNGWLVNLENGLKLKLFNPLTKSQFLLPPVPCFPDVKKYNPKKCGGEFLLTHPTTGKYYTLTRARVHIAYIHKIVLWSSSNDFIAVAIYSKFSKLPFTRLGDNKWNAIPSLLDSFEDCIFFDGKIYAINRFGDLMMSLLDSPAQALNMEVTRPELTIWYKLYLVSTDDELMMVERVFNSVKVKQVGGRTSWVHKTIGFNLFTLKRTKERARWLKINKLDDYTIFLGLNTSICISTKYCPKLKGNQIYYTYDQIETHTQGKLDSHDFGVFDVAEESCRSLLHNSDDPSNLFVWPHPVWVMLNPH